MRIGKIGYIAAACVVGLICVGILHHPKQATADTTEDRSVFYRLLAKYQHEDEVIEFDIAVGCAVKVTRYTDGGSSYDAFRDPIFFVRATADGSAVLQIVPDACQGQTTATGEVPEDFLPGAIWFEDATDLSFGIAYVSEDAFENPKSELKFLGATISKASRRDWENFQPIASRNLLNQRPFIFGRPEVPLDQVAQGRWDREVLKKWLPVLSCKGYARYRVTDLTLKQLLDTYWPRHKPDYWVPDSTSRKQLLDALAQSPMVDNIPFKRFSWNYSQDGFATRAQGGRFYSGKPTSAYPSLYFPLRAEDGVPWIVPSIAEAATIKRDVDMQGGVNAGFLYCYAGLEGAQDELREHIVPNYRDRNFELRVDGITVDAQGRTARPIIFFERNEYLFREYHFGLS